MKHIVILTVLAALVPIVVATPPACVLAAVKYEKRDLVRTACL